MGSRPTCFAPTRKGRSRSRCETRSPTPGDVALRDPDLSAGRVAVEAADERVGRTRPRDERCRAALYCGECLDEDNSRLPRVVARRREASEPLVSLEVGYRDAAESTPRSEECR